MLVFREIPTESKHHKTNRTEVNTSLETKTGNAQLFGPSTNSKLIVVMSWLVSGNRTQHYVLFSDAGEMLLRS